MRIAMIGGTGFIGRRIDPVLTAAGHTVVTVTRNRRLADEAGAHAPVRVWDPERDDTLDRALRGQDAVINLAGASIADGRWTRARKATLRASRIETTTRIVTALSRLPANVRPTVFVSASGVGFYGTDPDGRVDETTPRGAGFLADLCADWEREAGRAADHGLRTLCVRIGMVLGKDGGALRTMLVPFRLFLGGPVGHGRQPVSWIHADDLGRLMAVLLDNDAARGPVNAVSPHPVTMRELCAALGKVTGRPCWLPVPAFALRLGLGERATLLTHGQRVHPGAATALGFAFRYPLLESALSSLVGASASSSPPPLP